MTYTASPIPGILIEESDAPLTPEQIELLEAIADYEAELACQQPEPIHS